MKPALVFVEWSGLRGRGREGGREGGRENMGRQTITRIIIFPQHLKTEDREKDRQTDIHIDHETDMHI